jgi:hypothetical protein
MSRAAFSIMKRERERWPENTAGLYGTRLFFSNLFLDDPRSRGCLFFLLVLVPFLPFVLVFKRLLTNKVQDNDATLYSLG